MKRFNGDMQLAIGIIIVAAIYLFMDMRLPEIRLSDPLGPKAFPALVGVGLIASAFLLMLEHRHKRQAQAHADSLDTRAAKATNSRSTDAPATLADPLMPTPAVTVAINASAVGMTSSGIPPTTSGHASATSGALPAREPSGTKAKHPLLTLVGMVGWTALYDFCFTPLGYLIATFVFLLGLLSYFNRGRYKTNLAVAIGFTLVFDLLFSRLLGVPMPGGLLSI
jgi:putative tricarboxylic transport membrane protein